MTVLIATLTADFALLSTDTYVSRGVGIGGELHTARIDRNDVAVRVTHRFPAETEACAAAG